MVWAVAAISLCVPVDAGKVSLLWNKSSDPGVSGYRVRVVQTATGTATYVDVGSTNATVIDSLLEGQSYKIAVMAYTGTGLESDPSAIVNYSVPAFSGPT